jgi:hypothetical protein
MTTARTAPATQRKRRESRIDPYVVTHTWTREEILAARGMSPSPRRASHTRRALPHAA